MTDSAVTQVLLALIAAGVSLGLKWLDGRSNRSKSSAQDDTFQDESALEQTDEEYK